MEIERLRRMISEGLITPAMLASPDADQIFRFRRPLKAELIASMNRTRNFAIAQMRDELRRQGVPAR